MDLDLMNVHSFVVLIEERHFGRAARRLYVTPSALTKRVQRLERQVGMLLVDRTSGGIAKITPAGERLAQHAPDLLAAAAAAIDAAKQPLPGSGPRARPAWRITHKTSTRATTAHAAASQARRPASNTMSARCSVIADRVPPGSRLHLIGSRATHSCSGWQLRRRSTLRGHPLQVRLGGHSRFGAGPPRAQPQAIPDHVRIRVASTV
jgi:hypothetical protein